MILVTLLAAQTAAQPPAIAWEPLPLTASTGEAVAGATGWLAVPERHDQPGAAVVRLFVARLGSTAPNPGAPIVYLAGGPGNAGVPTRPDFSPLVLSLREVGDVIFWDQRGTGRSQPSLVVPGRLDLPSDRSTRSPESVARLRTVARLVADTLRARGIDPAAYSTAQSVEDLEALRRALGAERLVLWGHSYGSHLALAYLARYPGRVARLLIGGVNGTDHRWRPPLDGDALLARVDSAVRADARLRLALPDFLGTVRRVRDRLQREPLLVEQDGRRWHVGWDEVATTIAIQSGEQEFIRRLPALFTQLDAGQAEGFTRTMRQTLHERPIGTAMMYLMHLASGVSPARAARVAAEAPRALLGNAINWPFDDAEFRAILAPAALPESFRATVRSDVPALLYSGTFDGRTSVADAEEVRRGLTRAAHLVVDGSAHTPHLYSAALTQAMRDFVAGRPVRSGHLAMPLDLRSPHEPAQVAELMRLVQSDGAAAAVARLRALHAEPAQAVTSYVPGIVAQNLLAQQRPADAVAVLEAGVALFPANAFLHERLGDGHLALADTARARAAWTRAVELDPVTISARIKLRR